MNNGNLRYDRRKLRFSGLVGTGGIGSGKFFVLDGNRTLGREESRTGHFLDVKDYCKQHIILYYVRKLMGHQFHVFPIGRIGDDDAGHLLYEEMKSDGFDMKWIEMVAGRSTLFSFCFFYPDGSGGNLTTGDSASSLVDVVLIEKAENDIRRLGPEGMIVAAPEVPLEARMKLIETGKKHGAFCAASFTSGEIGDALQNGIIKSVDLLSLNIDEASAAAGAGAGEGNEEVAESAVKKLSGQNDSLKIAVTAGKEGSWCWDGSSMNKFPAAVTGVISTAGAGDAFFAGLLCGIALDLPLFEAQQLATLIAGFSVTSPHTINRDIDRRSLNNFMGLSGLNVSQSIQNLLSE